MIGAIVGDIVGSIYEFNNHRSKRFELFGGGCDFTDDSVMTLAVARAILDCGGDRSLLAERAAARMHEFGRHYPGRGYGGMFARWLRSDAPEPYDSFGNGAAMRVSPCGWAARSEDEVKAMSRAVTEVTHGHPEGIKGAECAAVCVWLARHGASAADIRACVVADYYPLDFTIDGIRETYQFNETCQDTVPQAVTAFLEASGFEDAIRTAISVGGDSDTLAAITGGIAEAAYGVSGEVRARALAYLDDDLRAIVSEFEAAYGGREGI